MLPPIAVALAPASFPPTRPTARARAAISRIVQSFLPHQQRFTIALGEHLERACAPAPLPALARSPAAQARPLPPPRLLAQAARGDAGGARPFVLRLARDSSPRRTATSVRSRWSPASLREETSPARLLPPSRDRPAAASDSARAAGGIRETGGRRRSRVSSPRGHQRSRASVRAQICATPLSLTAIARSFPTTMTRPPSAKTARSSGSAVEQSKYALRVRLDLRRRHGPADIAQSVHTLSRSTNVRPSTRRVDGARRAFAPVADVHRGDATTAASRAPPRLVGIAAPTPLSLTRTARSAAPSCPLWTRHRLLCGTRVRPNHASPRGELRLGHEIRRELRRNPVAFAEHSNLVIELSTSRRSFVSRRSGSRRAASPTGARRTHSDARDPGSRRSTSSAPACRGACLRRRCAPRPWPVYRASSDEVAIGEDVGRLRRAASSRD